MKRLWQLLAVAVAIGVMFGAILIYAWVVDETHFARPDARFDDLAAQVESLSGTSELMRDRWVEAPLFADPTSWVSVTVEESALPRLREAVCASDYPDDVRWTLRVSTDRGSDVSLGATTAPSAQSHDREDCWDFGLDAPRLIDALDEVAPGLTVQTSVWDDGRFALVELDGSDAGYGRLLPLVAHSAELLEAAGLDANQPVQVNAATLDVSIEAAEQGRYLTLLTELSDRYGVTHFWADGAGTPSDGVRRVQLVAPESQHEAIEKAIASSGLQIADRPIRFVEL